MAVAAPVVGGFQVGHEKACLQLGAVRALCPCSAETPPNVCQCTPVHAHNLRPFTNFNKKYPFTCDVVLHSFSRETSCGMTLHTKALICKICAHQHSTAAEAPAPLHTHRPLTCTASAGIPRTQSVAFNFCDHSGGRPLVLAWPTAVTHAQWDLRAHKQTRSFMHKGPQRQPVGNPQESTSAPPALQCTHPRPKAGGRER